MLMYEYKYETKSLTIYENLIKNFLDSFSTISTTLTLMKERLSHMKLLLRCQCQCPMQRFKINLVKKILIKNVKTLFGLAASYQPGHFQANQSNDNQYLDT